MCDVNDKAEMSENELETALNAIGTLLAGEIVISKKCGSGEVAVETSLHPFLAIYLIVDALSQMLYRAGHTGDQLELDLSGENVRKLLHQFADQIADGFPS